MISTSAISAASGHSAALPCIVIEGAVFELARSAAKGDRSAFASLMVTHKEGLYRFVRRRTPDAEDAYDIVQEAFVAAWRSIDRFDPERPFGAWLRSIALNKCRDRARRAFVRRGLRGVCEASAVERLSEPRASPEDDLVARDELDVLSRALEALPDYLRNALIMTAVDGLSQAAASAVIGCSVKSIEYRVHRAREIIKRQLYPS
jgi:RNA polymerase sigma factor CnrH